MNTSLSNNLEQAEGPSRELDDLTRLERNWLGRRVCAWCEINLLSKCCGSMYRGKMELPIVEGVREQAETIDLGPPCDMNERRAKALQQYKPRRSASMRARGA